MVIQTSLKSNLNLNSHHLFSLLFKDASGFVWNDKMPAQQEISYFSIRISRAVMALLITPHSGHVYL